MNDFFKKLMSRKFWLAVSGVVFGIAMSVGVNATEITTVAGGVIALISCISYIFVEGKIDAEAVKNAVIGVQGAIDSIRGGDNE